MNKDERAAEMMLGFDVCGSETRTSMDTYASHVRYLNLLGRPAVGSAQLGRQLPDEWFSARKTHVTCHAGEDFDHILTGLRHVDEAIEFFSLQKGDRIGHGIALGIIPDRWMQRVGARRIFRLGEWLDDLVWFYHWLSTVGKHADVRHQAEEQIEFLARRIYREYYGHARHILAEDLFNAWRLRSEEPPECYSDITDDPPINHLSFGGRRFAELSRRIRLEQADFPSRELWLDYHTDPHARSEWYKTIEVELNPGWNPAIETVRQELLKKLVRAHIVIEINPSSNATLGPFDDMKEHPVFSWMDPRTDFKSSEGPMVVVGTDDPSVFATELIHEYAFLGRAAEELGATQRQVYEWLEYLRQAGVRYSFFPRESFENA